MALESPYGELTPSAHVELDRPGDGAGNLGVFIGGIGAASFVGATIWALATASLTAVSFGVGALVCVLIGGYLVFKAQRETKLWEDFEFHFPEWGLSLGSTPAVTVIRRSKTSIPDESNVTLPASIRCQELVRYQVGTDTKTERHNVVDAQLEVVGSIQDNTFTGVLTLPIPADCGAPTLDLDHNEISWLLSVEPAHLSTLDFTMKIDIPVRAVLDKRHRQIVDGPPPPTAPISDA